jgi:hypothetical protein
MKRLDFLSWFLIGGVAILFIYEFVAAYQNAVGHDPLTISQLIWRGSELGPALPFVFGLLFGHLVFPHKVQP